MSTALTNTTVQSATHYTQRHQGQLEDYNLLLAALRDPQLAGDQLLRPSRFSPMDLDSRTAQDALKALEQLTEQENREASSVESYSKLTIPSKKDQPTDGNRTSVSKAVTPRLPTTHPKWQVYQDALDNAVQALGGTIRRDGQFSLQHMARYYGNAPGDLQSPAQRLSAIDALEEKRACHVLELENGLELDELLHHVRPEGQKAHESLLQRAPHLAQDPAFKDYLARRSDALIIETIVAVLPPRTTLVAYLSSGFDLKVEPEAIRAKPTVYLQKLLNANRAQTLAGLLIKALGWYGANPGEQTAPSVRNKLVCHAIRLYCHAPSAEAPDEIAGYNVQKTGNWGKSYQSIRAEFEAHLLKTRRASSVNEAIILARIYQAALPKTFSIRDIPAELPYRSSVVWVNFAHAVLLAEALGEGLLQRLSFQQLVELPLALSEGASEEDLASIALARVVPALEWAVTQGIVIQRKDMDYSVAEIEQAVKALDEHSEQLRSAITRIDVTPPDRLAMAKAQKDKLFPGAGFDDGRKLVLKEKPAHVGPGLLKTPSFVVSYTFEDVCADGQFNQGKTWLITETDGETTDNLWVRMDAKRRLFTNHFSGFDEPPHAPYFNPNRKVLPDISAQFQTKLDAHLVSIKGAYETLIISLFATLPPADRQILDRGKVQLLSLRGETKDLRAIFEKPEMTMPLRTRMGFVLRVTHEIRSYYYEVLPRTGFIRRRDDITSDMLGPAQEFAFFTAGPGAPFIPEQETLFSLHPDLVNRSKSLPFDWDAHTKGTVPNQDAQCSAILDAIGDSLPAKPSLTHFPSLSSPRFQEIAKFISGHFLFVDETALRAYARGQTQFDIKRQKNQAKLQALKSFVPFWSSIDDLMSGDAKTILEGVIGLGADLASFLFPIGKFMSGSLKIAMMAGKVSARTSLRSFGTLTRKLMTSTLKNLNPIEGLPTLLKSIVRKGIVGVIRLSSKGIRNARTLTGSAGSYSFIKGLPQVSEPGRWRPLIEGDQLARFNRVSDVPTRSIPAADATPRHFLVDPLSSRPYGPGLSNSIDGVSPGRSAYSTVEKTDSHVVVHIGDNNEVVEILEVDGRTTLLIDDVPYRLDADVLRRADDMDIGDGLKALPCRIRRAPGAEVCQTRYVTRTPAPTPDIGLFDDSKGWAPWFGDSIYTPATNRAAMESFNIATHPSFHATMEFQKGLYGRVKVSIPVAGEELVDTFDVGTTIVEAMDGSKHYLFTRLNAGDFYVAEIAKGQSVRDALIFRKASTLPDEVRKELLVVYTGSLNANNTVRIHGVEAVERALKTMEEIAIPIGGHANPPDTLKWLKVDTSPGEAAMFDHSTRMIISKLPEGATSWSRSKDAPEAFRQRTAEIFDTLFLKTVITPKNATSALKIDATMHQFHKLLPYRLRQHSVRNIAYAEVITAAGKREVYVSVSGAQGATGHLPLFKHNRGMDEVIVGETTYFNIDRNASFPSTSLHVTDEGKLLAVPHTIGDIDNYRPDLTSRPTSLDSESKLISVIRKKYPNRESMKSVDVATTMPPCDSCSVVMKEFAYDGGENALQVLWK
ncbi:deaminase domain-containing protein [Pseudomonas nunensis]|uniref:deaminase domain-containing protein n=1 Tax=Pseudomonas nunensis TaxID=2961896 RepID=UPI0006C5A337|nr:deaminase domain-containing protein [Pseudomonas nunensis]KOY00075.1 hypothetical protein AM274_22170 [Pseudomonas nunensis]